MPRPLELRGAAPALLDDPLGLEVRGAGPDERLRWRARIRDDEGRVWRAEADDAASLLAAWAPAKAGTGPVAALQSLRPVDLDVRVEAPDGRMASRTLTRRLLADGVRLRRWRDGLSATLHLPATAQPGGVTVLLDATGGDDVLGLSAPAATLLASRGVLVLAVGPPPAKGREPAETLLLARDRLAAVPSAGEEVVVVPVADVPVAPGIPARKPDPRAPAAWDALLARLGARSRGRDPGWPGPPAPRP